MKQLERVVLMQYFLYESADIEVAGNTAFLGPNGAGKTALLDALQIVMLGADGNRLFFNASGEGGRRARGLWHYCLGVVDGNRARDRANTYIDLIFRDSETREVFTAGVALSADYAAGKHDLEALYIAPGLALTSSDHVETQNGGDVTLPWREFRFVLESRCAEAGTKLWPAPNAKEFVRHLLVEHMASPGDRPNPATFRNVFPRALRLGESIDDLGEMLRTQLIEPKVVDVQGFRRQVSLFRQMRDDVQRLKDRLERASAIASKYEQVKRARAREANLTALQAVLDTEAAGAALGVAQEERAALEQEIDHLQKALTALDREAVVAQESFESAIRAREADPEYQKQAGHNERVKDLERTIERRRGAIGSKLDALRKALEQFALTLPAADSNVDAAGALEALKALEHGFNDPAADVVARARKLAKGVATLCAHASKLRAAAEADEREANRDWTDARTAAERASQGLPELRPMTIQLQRALQDTGISTTPICDLVGIQDERWQQAIEAYLGPHVEALLVHRRDELPAVDAYRGLRGEARVYGVKLALPSRIRRWNRSGPGRYAAELIDGDPDATNYLRSELGRLQLAESSEDLRSGDRCISQDGMVAKGGGVERMRLPNAANLRIGRRDQAQANERAKVQVQEAGRKLAEAQAASRTATTIANALLSFSDGGRWAQEIESDWREAVDATTARELIQRELAGSANAKLQELESAVRAARERLSHVSDRQKAAKADEGKAGSRMETATGDIARLQVEAEQAAARERETRQAKLYNAAEVERLRADFADKRQDQEPQRSAIENAIHRSQSAAAASERDGWQWFCDYTRDFNCRNHDITGEQWERAHTFVAAERDRIADTEIVQYEHQANTAYEKATEAFRHGVASALLEGFTAVREQVAELNAVLRNAPPFSNNERYQFHYEPVAEHRPLYDFLLRIRDQGASETDIFGGAGEIPDEFRAMLEDDATAAVLESSPLQDHRRFFTFDVQITRDGNPVGTLSKRFGHGSGGEHYTPLYVIFGAALAAAYGAPLKSPSGFMLLDEAFKAMDSQNTRATAKYFHEIGLQLILAAPESEQPKLSSFLSTYYDIARYGSGAIDLVRTDIQPDARRLLESDDYLLHPELVTQELTRIADAERATE